MVALFNVYCEEAWLQRLFTEGIFSTALFLFLSRNFEDKVSLPACSKCNEIFT